MISRKHRFHGHRSVARVRGGRAQATGIRVFFVHTKRDDYRMAVVVSKKVSKSAVTRNRIRRRLYESVRKQKLLNNHSVDAVFVVQQDSFATKPATEIDETVAKLCKQILTKRT